jgi:hypothetical protein
MNINDLIVDFAEAVAEDITIKAWCQIHYSSDHKVYVGIDMRSPPQESDCPYVILYPERKELGQHRREKFHEFEIISCLYDTSARSHAGVSNLVEYTGIQNIETFRKMVEDAVSGVDIGNLAMAFVAVDYETIESFPFFMCGMVVQIWEGVTIGSDPLL